MTKLKLENKSEFESLLNELKEDEIDITFKEESSPLSYPCIAIHLFVNDVDCGNFYNIAFVYPKDFN